jgi:hypothetical protein
VCERIARCENEEHTERGINADDHERVVRVVCVPYPTRRPERRPGDHQRVKAENENDANEDEGDALSRVESLMANYYCAKVRTVNRRGVSRRLTRKR